MSRMARKILELSEGSHTRLVYGVAASATTVYVDGSTVAVTVPTLDDVVMVADDYVSILTDGADRLVIGTINAGAEYGSSASGHYVKYGNGVLECWHAWNATEAINSAYGSQYLGSTTWNYPATFIDADEVVLTVGRAQWQTGASWGEMLSSSTTVGTIRLFDSVSRASGTVAMRARAIGRWRT